MSTNQDTKVKENKKDKKSFGRLLFGKLFGGKKEELSIFEEEQVQSPFRTVIREFRDNKVAMTSFYIFLLIFLIVTIGPFIKPIDLSFSEISQQNVAPGFDFMKYPKELDGKVQDIDVGPTFSVGVDTDGKVYVWGKTRVSRTIDVKKEIPKDMGKVVKVAAGFDHVLALNEEGKLFAWGSDRQMQTSIPDYIYMSSPIKDIYAGYQNSVVLTEDGYVHYFGNAMNNDYYEFHPYQGQIKQIALTADAVIGLTFDGEVVYLGLMDNSYTKMPENMGNVIDIAATSTTVAALNDEGKVFVWGNISTATDDGNEAQVVETDSKIIDIEGGRTHYTALTESGEVVAWGRNYYNQASVPSSVKGAKIEKIFTDFYQNYAVDEKGNIHTWGLKGYLFGTDDLGRDIFTRLLNGGRLTITIGAVAVIISTIIGVVIGSLSGYFGGRLDMVLQRISEMVASLPFLPFAMILSSLIGNALNPKQRVYFIMVVLGLLSWPGLQRLVRAQVLSVREQEYVTAARALGIKKYKIVFRHILPNVISVILVNATLSFASSMLIESTLSFLGFGVQPPHPTWGNMLYGANNSIVIQNYWWRWVFASIALGTCVICINLIGDGLRDAIDPKSQER
mgnify:FL=1